MAGAVAVALALGGLVGGVLAERPAAAPTSAPPGALAERALSGAAGSIGAATVSGLEEQVSAHPEDAELLTRLGFAYQLRWRETADASFLRARRPRCDAPSGSAATTGRRSSASARSRSSGTTSARRWHGRRAQQLLPGSARPFGVVGDALVELGRYGEAFRAFERMVELRPGLASYARRVRARADRGPHGRARRDAAGARRGGRAAGADGVGARRGGQARAGAGEGRARRSRCARRARGLPWGIPPPGIELARIEAARGRIGRAVAEARRAAEAVPTSQAVSLLADLLDRAGRRAEAGRQRATVAVIDRLLSANGVQVDLESAVYRADNGIRPRETVELARRARADRPSIYGDDARLVARQSGALRGSAAARRPRAPPRHG